MTDNEIALLHLICDRFKGKAWKGNEQNFLKSIKCDEEALDIIKSVHFRSVLHGWGIALFFSRCDKMIRVVDITKKKLPNFIWGAGQCQFCGLFEEYPEIDLVPDREGGEGQSVHPFCRKPFQRLRGKLRLQRQIKKEGAFQ